MDWGDMILGEASDREEMKYAGEGSTFRALFIQGIV
jgi:hypothetical protein